MRKVKRKDFYIFLIGVFLFLGIGYAFLTTDLSINGTATMVSNSWDIHFDNLSVQNGSVSIGTGDTVATITSPTTISFAVTLAQPGDYYEFLVDIVNDGTLPGVISSIDVTPSTAVNSNIFGYSYTYTNNKKVKVGDIVDPSSFKTTDFKVFYKTDIEESDLPDSDVQQTITVTITFEQSDYTETKECTYNGELTQGAELVDGQFTYRYMQQNTITDDWTNMSDDGWGFRLTDKDSSVPVTTQMCSSINGKPIVSGQYAFSDSDTSSIDLTKLYTNDITNMKGMFRNLHLNSFDGSLLNTSNVTSMFGLFAFTSFDILDLSNFDTSNVTDMTYMFGYSTYDTLDLSHLNTSNVTTMYQTFYGANINYLNISGLANNRLENMSEMCQEATIGNIDFTGFNTSNVTEMYNMFYKSNIYELTLPFDTSNVTTMQGMFAESTISIIDISTFDTSAITSRYGLNSIFSSNSSLTTIYVGSGFVNSYNTSMFWGNDNLVGGKGTVCSGTPDKSYARIDNPPDAPGCFTDIADKP